MSRRCLVLLTATIASCLLNETGKAQSAAAPTALCHQTDGIFTACPGGATEWADVAPVAFPETNAYLYVSQVDPRPAARHCRLTSRYPGAALRQLR